MKFRSMFVLTLAVCLCTSAFSQSKKSKDAKPADDPMSSGTFSGLKFRCIGPALPSGRIIDLAVNPKDRSNYYVAVACGGVWKTINAGTTWDPVFENQQSFSIGCVAMDPENPHVVWVGTGENNSQRSVSYGDGIYRSEDGGKSWKNMGLKKSEHIGKIVIDPTSTNRIYVAVQGPLWAPGGDRGLYKSNDGGRTWKQILFISQNTGVTDVVMDPRNPNVLYAASYQRRRHVWTLINGGPEANIYKTTDGGDSWDTLRSGLPSVDKGRIGLAISPVNPDIIYATIEAAEGQGGFYCSTNRGASWEKRNDYVSGAAQYYQEVVCDPKDALRVYIMDTILMVSDDGGRTFRPLGNRHRHVDDHAMWIDPQNTNYYLVGGDGGLYESFDRGATWRYKENLPVTQFYRVSVDNTEPFYYVYGGTQDNNSLGGPSRTLKSDGIMNEDWFWTNGGDGFKSQVDPEDPNIVYAQAQYGDIVRFDRKSGERIPIQPMPAKDEEPFRWNWDSPLIISPHSHTRLYFAANKIFRSNDRGNSWKVVSPDLSRQIDRNTLPVMDKVWGVDAVAKNASTSLFGNIVALCESPLKEGVLYAGTDDGLIQATEDGGVNWTKIESVNGVPEKTYVSCLTPSQHNAGTIYAAFDNHKMADFKPYVFKSVDNGKSWNSISGNLPENGAVYTVAEDFNNPDLLFAGTEFGLYFTVDGGKKWIQLKSGLPSISIRDIAIQKRECDLVLATFGRSFYVLDDYSPLRNISQELLDKEAFIAPIKDALMYIPSSARQKGAQGETFFCAENPPFGATFTYYIKDAFKSKKEQRNEAEKKTREKGDIPPYPTAEQLRAESQEQAPYLIFSIADEQGNVLRTLTEPIAKGLHRIVWDLRYPDVSPVSSSQGNKGSGLLVMPGMYSVSLSKIYDGKETELVPPQKFTAKVLNVSTLPAQDRREMVAFQRKVAELQRVVLGAQRSAQELKTRLGVIKGTLETTPKATAAMKAARQAIEDALDVMLVAFNGDPLVAARNENQRPSIIGRLMDVVWGMWSTSSEPTQTQRDGYAIVAQLFTPIYAQLDKMLSVDLKNLEAQLDAINAPSTPGRLPKWDGQ
jgi:photosystem II stability/assembly factor-like uncharacterized protein